MTLPECLRDCGDGVLLSVRLRPRSSRNTIVGTEAAELRVSVTAPPVQDAANEALVRLISAALDIPRTAVQILRGHKSQHKVLKLVGVTAAEASARLRPLISSRKSSPR